MKYLIGLCILTFSVVTGFATTINFSTGVNQDLGTTHTFGGITATAYGSGTPDLYSKADGGDENGLGLTSDPAGQHEITAGNFIQLDLSGLQGITLTITMGSTTNPDAWLVFASNSALATSGTQVSTGTANGSFIVTPTMRYLDFTATSGNVLLDSLSYTTVPEPISFLLAGTGLIGIYFVRRRKNGSS